MNKLGYSLLGQKLLNEAIRIFELNVKMFPEYANGYDSLGDAYLEANEKQKAIEAYEKAVALGGSDIKLNSILKESK